MKAKQAAPDTTEQKVIDWIEREIGGEIQQITRQLRWREGWEVRLRTTEGVRRLIVRGSKGSNYFGPITMQQEARLHGILERHGIPVPHVYGMIDEPAAIVMDALPGQINLATAQNDLARSSIRRQYVEVLARLHAIPTQEFAAIGMPLPGDAKQIALNLYGPCETIYRSRMRGQWQFTIQP